MSAYAALLVPARFQPSTRPGRSILAEAVSDRSRILYSSAFRRLQQKAQVFSLVENAAVRSRLTHSLEVSDVGRLIAIQATEKLIEQGDLEAELQFPFITFVETACLMHDIGNPPFGHFGEAAIRRWFRLNWQDCYVESRGGKEAIQPGELEDIATRLIPDFIQFDGNPQGLRIVTRLQGVSLSRGMNLTWTQILSFLKYLRSPAEKGDDGLRKKAGFFESERELVETARRALGVDPDRRFPLTYIMEAADDVSYCASDLEDGIEKGLISPRDFFEAMDAEWPEEVRNSARRSQVSELVTLLTDALEQSPGNARTTDERFFSFKTKFTGNLVSSAAEYYVSKHDEMLVGRVKELLLRDGGSRTAEGDEEGCAEATLQVTRCREGRVGRLSLVD